MDEKSNQTADVHHTDPIPEAVLNKGRATKNKKRKPAKKLGEIFQIIREHDLLDAENIEITVLESMKKEFEKVYDPRKPSYVTYKLADVLIIVLLAVLANNNTWYDIEVFGYIHKSFLTKLLCMDNDAMPTDDTYRLIISHIDMNFVYGAIIRLLINRIDYAIEQHAKAPAPSAPDIIAYDGKASRSSGRDETFDQPKAEPLFTLRTLKILNYDFTVFTIDKCYIL